MNELALLPEINKDGLTALDKAKALQIESNEDFKLADEFAVALKVLEKEVDKVFDEHIESAFKAHRSLVAKKKSYAEPVIEARKVLKSKMSVYQDEQERLRQEEERKLQEQARKLEEDRKLAQASLAEQSGDSEEANAILESPVEAPPVVLPRSTPKTTTIIRKVWAWKLLDKNLVPDEYWMLDGQKIGAIVRATKGTLKILGIEPYEKPV